MEYKKDQDQWTGIEHQFPAPKIEIFTQGKPGNPDYSYTADPLAGPWSKLLAYSFSESVEDLEGSFSFKVENEEIEKDGKTVFDLIPTRSIVKIYEGDEKQAAFVGIIRRRRIDKAMTAEGMKRSVVFSGKSIISCITEYTLSLDVRIQGVADAMSKTKDLTGKLAQEGMTIKNFMKESWEHFKEVSEVAGISTTGIADTINKFIGGGSADTFIEVTGKEELRYNIACTFYNAANNVIADVWRNILPKPVYEFFSRCSDGEPKIVARQVPFNPEDWSKLDIYEISPISLTAYDFDRSDDEIYTAFASYIMGSAMSREFYMAVNQTGNDSIVAYDAEKQKLYGFKPLEITFSGYDRQGNIDDEKKPDLTEALKELNKMAAYWYSRLDDMYSGSITICTDFNNPETNPRAGCRAKFLGGEFYITKTEHTWTYGGTPTIKASLSRGMVYDGGGEMRSGEDGILKTIGKQFRELEREAV